MGNPLTRFKKVEDIKADVKRNTQKLLTQSGEPEPQSVERTSKKTETSQPRPERKTSPPPPFSTSHSEEDLSHPNVKTDWSKFKKIVQETEGETNQQLSPSDDEEGEVIVLEEPGARNGLETEKVQHYQQNLPKSTENVM
ncbi:hypothetical protein QOT17_011457 [Balamuthia mandrillaris]